DFKPELTHNQQAVRVLQLYADHGARARLRSDASAGPAYAIRGLLVVTGEDQHQQAASAMARTVVIDVPGHRKDPALADRCLARRGEYPALMADFVAWALSTGATGGFADRVRRHRGRYLDAVAHVPNGMRVAGHLARLAAALEVLAEYLDQDGTWPGR